MSIKSLGAILTISLAACPGSSPSGDAVTNDRSIADLQQELATCETKVEVLAGLARDQEQARRAVQDEFDDADEFRFTLQQDVEMALMAIRRDIPEQVREQIEPQLLSLADQFRQELEVREIRQQHLETDLRENRRLLQALNQQLEEADRPQPTASEASRTTLSELANGLRELERHLEDFDRTQICRGCRWSLKQRNLRQVSGFHSQLRSDLQDLRHQVMMSVPLADPATEVRPRETGFSDAMRASP